MSGLFLERKLQAVSQRLQKVRILRRQTLVWLLLLVPAIAITLYLPRREGRIGPEVPVVLISTLLGISLARVLARRPSLNEAARLIEQADSEVNDAVLTAVEVMQSPAKQSSVLAGMAVMDAEKLARQRDWSAAVPGRQIAGWTVLSFLTFLLMASSVTAASRYIRTTPNADIEAAKAEADLQKKPPVTELVIEPGNTEIELGTALTVVAKFPGTVPQKVVLELEDTQKQVRQLSMTETVDAGVFAARMEEITSDGTYRVLYLESEEAAAAKPSRSADFLVKTFVRPRLEQIDATVTPPAWTRKSEETVEDIARITVTEGSSVLFRFQLNKPGVKAELRSENESAIPLAVSASDPTVVESQQVVTANHSWTIHLTDAEGRTAADEETLTVKVTRNQPPVIKPTFPGRDVNVSSLEEFLVEASAKDDFGLLDYGIEYSLSGSDPTTVSTKAASAAAPSAAPAGSEAGAEAAEPVQNETAATISGQIQLESLNAAPDDLVTYSYWAKDHASDGTVRTTYSDLMFAEVRRFEEIFREGQQQGQQQQQQRQQQQQQQQQQQGGAADELLKVQKEILSATWNTLQTEAIKRDAGTFSEDVGVIAESQGQLIQQLQSSLEEREVTPEIQALATAAADLMTQAQNQLQEVRDGKAGTTLRNAMTTESRILAALYRMREAEYNVQRQQQGGGGGGGGGGSASAQQQLQQLELDNERNRYESERQAQQQQEANSAQREELQILNRLKELARRQQMMNERLKQLESELRAAQTDKEKEEIERELKRLREEQRDLLRDTDDVAERMEQSQQSQQSQESQSSQQSQESEQSRTADREQLQQEIQEARNNVQQASRAMDEGRLAEAISEGTRAERQFDDLKEDFRNQTSNRFDEAARDLRDEARELAEEQEKIARELAGESDAGDSRTKSPSLRSERKKEDIEQKLQEQQDRLNQIVDDSKKLIEQAEQTEPLLSSRLYDAVRDLKDTKPEEALEAAEMLAGRGLWPQTQEAEQQARKGIERLKEGIEKAADAVVGSEAESLRRAQEQLQGVTEQLANEVRNATGEQQNGQQQNGQQQNGQQQNGQQQNGQQQNGQQQNGQQQNGQQQNGQQQNGQQQNGQQQNGQQPNGQQQNGQQQNGQQQNGQQQNGQQQNGQQQNGQQQNGQQQDGQQQNGQQQNGQQQNGQQQNGQQQNGQQQNGQQQNGQQQNGQQQQRSALMNGGRESNGGLGANNTPGQPLTGNEFGQWSDQLRDVEEMLDDPELRNRVAQVRDRARAIRSEFKRHGTEPQWDLVKSQLLGELQSLQQRIAEDLQKMKSDRAMVPIDREPVPEEFDSMVQRYYELLGQERLKEEPESRLK
ncbi:MAG: hypothetical protein U0996_08590 [Planctomycetaceae bacterium]